MNSKLFFNEIRKIIREEVQSALKTILAEGKTKNEQPLLRSPSVQKQKPRTESSPTSIKDLLNETYEDMKNNPDSDSERTFNFTSEDAKAFGYDIMRERGREPVPSSTIVVDGRHIPTSQLDSSVVNALTKDYSALLKKVDEVKKKKLGNNG